MYKISKLELLSPRNVLLNGICTLRPPKIDYILDVGEDLYNAYLKTIAINFDNYLEIMGLKEKFQQYDASILESFNIFDSLIAKIETRELLFKALCFFIAEKLEYDDNHKRINILNEKNEVIGYIDKSNYEDIKSGILQLNFLGSEDVVPNKKCGSKSKAILAKLLKGRQEMAKNKKQDDNMSLCNIVASVCSYHNSYNLTNIWSLTVYQLYDQFFRLNSKVQLDVMGLRWAAWGKEEFDFSVWFKDLNLKK